ncbi:MAG: arsenic transporter [Candidatus Binatus sp.]|uniref:arsenic transporter n=1 Tax=Candidatus Binatus sp. TaxID=2811406 RepID=UPI003C728B64
MTIANATIWAIAALSTLGVIARPWKLPEATWAVTGAVMLVVFGLLPWSDALKAVAKGTDVYLFLSGMMLLAELARKEGLFDFLAGRAARMAGGSAMKLFALVYAVGTVVTVFMSNDATAVVLTPAVFAATRAAKVKDPLPYLLICAFIANAASFVLPISNPANLIIFRDHMPPLLQWLGRFALPSILSIAVTYAVLRFTQRDSLKREVMAAEVNVPGLSIGGRMTACGIVGMGIVLLLVSGFGVDLGLPTFVAAVATAAVVLFLARESPWTVMKDAPWEILPLVAGLFVLVEALDRSGVLKALIHVLQMEANRSAIVTTWVSGVTLALVCNLVNNLPAGLLAGSVVSASHVPRQVASAVLIGVDLGPNLSVTGSLATILWLTALRRENQNVSAWSFLKLGALVMPPALILAIAGLLVTGSVR